MNKKTYNKIRIFAVGCSHAYHEQIKVPENVDIMIHTGDESNYRDWFRNEQECIKFLKWYGSQKATHKIFVAGNHSSAIYEKYVKRGEIESYGITYLEDEGIYIDDLFIYGTPWTKNFFNWSFMKSEAEMAEVWKAVPDYTDILVTHSPVYGILDKVTNQGFLECCGCPHLLTAIEVDKMINPLLVVHSHIHDNAGITNFGTAKVSEEGTVYANVSLVEDGKFGEGIKHNDILFEIEDKKIINITET